jgi:hypothetical protein
MLKLVKASIIKLSQVFKVKSSLERRWHELAELLISFLGFLGSFNHIEELRVEVVTSDDVMQTMSLLVY